MSRTLEVVENEIVQYKRKLQELEKEASTLREDSGWSFSGPSSWFGRSSSKKTDEKTLKLEQKRLETERKAAELRRQIASDEAYNEQKYREEKLESDRRAYEIAMRTSNEQKRVDEENRRLGLETQRMKIEEANRLKSRVNENAIQTMEERDRNRKDCERRETEFGVHNDQKLRQQNQDLEAFNRDQNQILKKNDDQHKMVRERVERDSQQHRQRLDKELEEKRNKLLEVDEKVRRIAEESRRKYEHLRRQFEQQLEYIQKMLETAEWGRSVEKNWEVRLNALRSTSRRVQAAVGELRQELAAGRVTDGWGPAIETRLDCLKMEAGEVGDIMAKEAGNLDKMYQMTGKSFVQYVANSVRDAHSFCKSIVDLCTSQQHQNWTREHSSAVYNQIGRIEVEVSNVFLRIPTIESLKSQFETPTYQSGGERDEHVVRIEEIE